MRKYLIYIIKNTVNDKVYIGQTSQSLHDRFSQHKKPSTIKKRGSYKLYNAMEKYGIQNFYCELIEDNIDESEIDAKEIYYIEKYNSYKNGYNSTMGADSKTICKIQDVELLTKLFNENKTMAEIANIFNVNKITIQRTLHSLGLRYRKSITIDFLLANLHKTNLSIAEELGVHPDTISRYFKKYNIKRGKGCNNYLLKQNQKQIKKCNDYPDGE